MDGVTIFPSFELLRDMGLCHTASYPAWLRLQSDWMLWKEGKSPVSLVGTPWLVNEHGKEVSQDEKVMFFTLLEIFKTPIDTFEYCPSTITQPQLTIDHTYASGLDIAVRLDAISDSGLISDADPLECEYRKPEDVQKFFDTLKIYARDNTNKRLMILGDLNCHKGEKSTHKNDLKEMRDYLCDLVEDTDITYFPGKTTIDHVLISKKLESKTTAQVIPQEILELSDHAVIIVTVDENPEVDCTKIF